jgi:hypothetical protein
MYPKFDFIRRFANEASQVARLVAFNLELDIELDVDEIIAELEVRGYRIHAGR